MSEKGAELDAPSRRAAAAAAAGDAAAAWGALLAAHEQRLVRMVAFRWYQLTRAETAHALGIQERAAARRYVRALARLNDMPAEMNDMPAEMPGGLTGLRP